MKKNLLFLKDLLRPSQNLQIYDFSVKNVDIDKLAGIVNKYNNTYHGRIKMKSADVNLSTYVNRNKENRNEDSRFEVGYLLRNSEYKEIFAKGYV